MPPTICEPVGIWKLPACVVDVTLKLVKSRASDHLTIRGSRCSGDELNPTDPGPAAVEPQHTRICSGIATKIPPLKVGAVGTKNAGAGPRGGGRGGAPPPRGRARGGAPQGA